MCLVVSCSTYPNEATAMNPSDAAPATLFGLLSSIPAERTAMAGAENVGTHKTSMPQDREAGRPMELEAVVGAVVESGERLGVVEEVMA